MRAMTSYKLAILLGVILVILAGLGIVITQHSGTQCSVTAIDSAKGTFQADGHTVIFAEPDDPSAPIAWLGPVSISQGTKGSCSVSSSVSILTRPIYTDNHNHLWLTTYSGDNYTLTVVDINTCAIVWQSAPTYGLVSEKDAIFQLGSKQIPLTKECLPGKGG